MFLLVLFVPPVSRAVLTPVNKTRAGSPLSAHSLARARAGTTSRLLD